ncbi:hypothetical protein ABK040_015324 [Willaertia magna]
MFLQKKQQNYSPHHNNTVRTVHIGNLPSFVGEDDLKSFFSSCGTITAVRLAGDATYERRFAFVEFIEPSQANAATTYDGAIIGGSPVKIALAKHDSQSKSYNRSGNNHHHNNNNHNVDPMMQQGYYSAPIMMYNNNANGIVNGGDPVSRTVYISGIHSDCTEQDLIDYFKLFGEITNYRMCTPTNTNGQSNNSSSFNNGGQYKFAFIEFASSDQAKHSMTATGTSTLGKLKVGPSKTAIQLPPRNIKSLLDRQYKDLIEKTIHVGGIDVKLTQEQIKNYFEGICGKVRKLAMAGETDTHATRFCFIEFEDKNSALQALQYSGCTIPGSVKQIKVSLSKSPIGYSKHKINNNNTMSPQHHPTMYNTYPPTPNAYMASPYTAFVNFQYPAFTQIPTQSSTVSPSYGYALLPNTAPTIQDPYSAYQFYYHQATGMPLSPHVTTSTSTATTSKNVPTVINSTQQQPPRQSSSTLDNNDSDVDSDDDTHNKRKRGTLDESYDDNDNNTKSTTTKRKKEEDIQ